MWASAGPLSLTGDEDRAPVPIGVGQAFIHAAAEAAGAALVALHERSRSGLGQHVDISAQQAAAQATQAAILAAPNNASTHMRISGGLKLAGHHLRLVWACKDGFVSITLLFGTVIGVFTKRFVRWMFDEGFCDEAIRDKDWINYGTVLFSGAEPVDEYNRLKDCVAALCLTRTKAELLQAAMDHQLLIAPVLGVDDMVHSDQLAARGYWEVVDGVSYPGPFGKLSATALAPAAHAPRLGADTEAVLAEPARTATTLPAVPERRSPGVRALDGLKVLDLMWVMAGPAGSRVLADHGATVVRVESANRVETARTLQPFRDDVAGVDNSALYANLNAGKLGLGLDLTRPEGREVLLDLVRWADVVLESFSPKAMRNWGLGYDALRQVNPRMVMLSSCLFGQTGPLSRLAGFGTMAAALSGFFGVTGWPDRPPCGPYGAYTDYISPRFANAILLAAVDHARRTGEGQYIDFAQAEAAVHVLGPAVLDYTLNHRVWQRAGTDDPNLHPHGVHPGLGDQCWIAVSCENDAQRTALAAVVGGLGDGDIAAWTSARDVDKATLELQALGIPAHPVQNSPECMADPQLAHRNHFVTLPHASLGSVVIEGPRAHFSGTPPEARSPGPFIGEHSQQVLTDILGYDDDRFTELLISGALE